MSSAVDGEHTDALVLEYDFDEPPEKVWRAVSVPELREKWLPQELLADGEPISSLPGTEIRYRMRDDEAPFLGSIVTFEVSPRSGGGTRLTIVHRLANARLDRRPPAAANRNRTLMRAA
jgi:uncharacterized protein YndB with AHSA1/START domain